MKRKNYTISEVTEKQLIELKEKLGCKASEAVRRAVGYLWENKIEKKGV